MKTYKYPEKELWGEIISRPRLNLQQLNETVSTVLADVKKRGDEAVKEYELKFDKAELASLAVTEQEMDEAEKLVSKELYDAIVLAHENIHAFHAAQHFEGKKVETRKGVTCWQKSVAIERVGLYIPGGTAPLFSTVLMLATPAKIAGCKEIVLCTPPNREGKVNPAILVAARIAGVSKIFKAGGVQAIGAMAYGTESVPKVYKIFGPGNQYVMAAKQQVSLDEVAIDMPAGPSEVCVLADETANATFVAADLLSQADGLKGLASSGFTCTNCALLLDGNATFANGENLTSLTSAYAVVFNAGAFAVRTGGIALCDGDATLYADGFSYGGTEYYQENATVALGCNHPSGYSVTDYSVSGATLGEGNSFTMPSHGVTVTATGLVANHIDTDGTEQTHALSLLSSSEEAVTKPGGWYAVMGDVTFSQGLTFSSDAYLFLSDGVTMTAERGITIADGGKLTVDGSGLLVVTNTQGTPGESADLESAQQGGRGGDGGSDLV